MTTPASLSPPCPVPVHRLIPFVYVADVEASLAFYALLGFEVGGVERFPDGRVRWAWAQSQNRAGNYSPVAIMFERSSEPLDSGAQGFFFYMHCANVAALRSHLLARGLRDGGGYVGRAGANREPNMVYNIIHPPYMPEGEFRIHDPDGYCVLAGQCR